MSPQAVNAIPQNKPISIMDEKDKPISDITASEWLSMEEEKAKRIRPVLKKRIEILGESVLKTAEVCMNTKTDVNSNLLPVLSVYKDTFVEYLHLLDSLQIQDCKKILSVFENKILIDAVGVDSLVFNFRDLCRILESIKYHFEMKLIDQETKVELLGIDENWEQNLQRGDAVMIGDKKFNYGTIVKFLNDDTPILASIKKGRIKKHIKLLDQLLIEVKLRIGWFMSLKNQSKPTEQRGVNMSLTEEQQKALYNELKNNSKALRLPVEQRGFNLGLNEPQLKKLYHQLIDEKFLAENTNLNYFINAFNGKVLEEGFQQLVFKPISMLTIFVNTISIKYTLFIDKWVTTAIVFKSPNNKQLSNQYLQAYTTDKAKRVNRLFENLLNEL